MAVKKQENKIVLAPWVKGFCNPKSKSVIMLDPITNNTVSVFGSCREAAKAVSGTHSSINSNRDKNTVYKGYKWVSYVNTKEK